MKKLLFTLFIPLSLNAQSELLPHIVDTSDISDWSLNCTGGYNPNSPYSPEAVYAFAALGYNTMILEKSFDFSNSIDATLIFDFVRDFGVIALGYIIEVNDIEYFNHPPTNSNVSDSINLTISDIDSFENVDSTIVRIYISCETELGNYIGHIKKFEINHTPKGIGLDEDRLNDLVQINSIGNSVIITTDEPVCANVYVHDISGQLVNYEMINLSQSKYELRLYDNPSGIFFVTVLNEESVITKKIFIK